MSPREEPPAWFPPLGCLFAGCSAAALGCAMLGGPWWWPLSAALVFLSAILVGGVLEARRNRGGR
jgi:fatty acid desaturase